MGFKLQKQYRLPNYDYSTNGYYFVTICTKNREHFFGKIRNEKMKYSEIGKIAKQYWENIPDHFLYAKLDVFQVMPNHIHGIIMIGHTTRTCTDGGNTVRGVTDDFLPNDPFWDGQLTVPTEENHKLQPQPKSLSIVIREYKAAVTGWSRSHNLINNIWQLRFHDRIIRDHDELERIREYIKNNPAQWDVDRNNLQNLYM